MPLPESFAAPNDSDWDVVSLDEPRTFEPLEDAAKPLRDTSAEFRRTLSPLIDGLVRCLDDRVQSCDVELSFSRGEGGALVLCDHAGQGAINLRLHVRRPA